MNKANKELMDLESSENQEMSKLSAAQQLEEKNLNSTKDSIDARSQQDSFSQKISDFSQRKMLVVNVYSAL